MSANRDDHPHFTAMVDAWRRGKTPDKDALYEAVPVLLNTAVRFYGIAANMPR
ncbi:hypothetical protein [Xanthomonas phage JGB6]|nr:hypothetical protein [Xanthomonas phage JGB6]